jgi:hypothetical protein
MPFNRTRAHRQHLRHPTIPRQNALKLPSHQPKHSKALQSPPKSLTIGPQGVLCAVQRSKSNTWSRTVQTIQRLPHSMRPKLPQNTPQMTSGRHIKVSRRPRYSCDHESRTGCQKRTDYLQAADTRHLCMCDADVQLHPTQASTGCLHNSCRSPTHILPCPRLRMDGAHGTNPAHNGVECAHNDHA